MSRKKESPFGQVIRERRRQLARRIKTSTPYIGHLEGGKRHPSERVVSRLAEVLGLERRELFLLANQKSGHVPYVEEQERYIEVVRNFLDRHPP